MTIISVPFHQDERLAEASIPLPADAEVVSVTPELVGGEIWHRLSGLYSAVAAAVAADIESGQVPTVVSGDCLVSLGVVTGVQRAGVDPSIVWFDAHGDVHTLASSTSGYLGGLSLRLVLGGDYSVVGERIGLRPLAERQAVLVGARDLDPAEAEYLASADIRRCTVDDVELPDGPLILHVDVDVIDSGDLPGLLFPVPDGPSLTSVLDAVRRIIATGKVIALDVAFPWHSAPEHSEIRAQVVNALVN
jgi:arginase